MSRRDDRIVNALLDRIDELREAFEQTSSALERERANVAALRCEKTMYETRAEKLGKRNTELRVQRDTIRRELNALQAAQEQS